ncbi:uncharacterized protein EV422DRAFT_540305 [Fimicolochytrium jonesii]|uniref:uncharacterized protein n=1 Tax=Fimicolochytrium jonesii TaxID=1396493 RepID=UPI0022FE779D|nr:uncharacterized protein EV422DRAFT_540305 [Fimicolochytrium jonesii]KAI8817875.1 hypothetical protein EV422DRAFT_540305 [Fimicolochytrium jonesii]
MSATLRLFRPQQRVRTRPFRTVTIDLVDGRLPLFYFEQMGIVSASLWTEDSLRLIGFMPPSASLPHYNLSLSLQTFTDGASIDVKAEEEPAYSRAEAFSEALPDTIMRDFGLEEDDATWTPAIGSMPMPSDLTSMLGRHRQRSLLVSESSRRTVISIYLTCALDVVDHDKEHLLVGEEIGVTLVKSVDRTDEGLGKDVVRYNGPLDFVVGHFPGDRRPTQDIASDAALCVVEAKKSKTFENGYYQVLAQASTILCHRRTKARGRGAYRTYFAYTDGERWAFGYLRPRGDRILVKRSAIVVGKLKGKIMDVEGCTRVYNHLIALIHRAYRSTPRNSRVDLSALDDSEQEEVDEDNGEGDEEVEDPDVDPTVVESVISEMGQISI